MPVFFYKGITKEGEAVEGSLEAQNHDLVVRQLQHQGILPLKVSAKSAWPPRFLASSTQKRSLSFSQLNSITRQLLTLIQAGLPLDRAMTVLLELNSNDKELSGLISNLSGRIKAGVQLSEALDKEGRFPKFYVSLIRAGEAGGALESVLDRLSQYLDSSTALRNTVLTALIYPALLVVMAIASLLLMLVFVVPQFIEMFQNSGKELPTPTLIVVFAAESIRSYWWIMVTLGVGLLLWIQSVIKNPTQRRLWEKRAYKAPLIGDLMIKIHTASFSRTLGALLKNGVALLPSIAIARETLADTLLSDLLVEVSESVKSGLGLSKPLNDTGFFPSLAMQMIRLGEESAQLPEMLEKISHIYDAEVKTSVQRLLALLEPVLIIGLGLMIGGIIVSMLMAILSVNDLAF